MYEVTDGMSGESEILTERAAERKHGSAEFAKMVAGLHTRYTATDLIDEFRQAMAGAGNVTVQPTEFELYYNIEKSIKMAVEMREYDIARALINMLPIK